jgi:DNA modification methylase
MTPERKILLGDCRETLKQLPDESVQCVVTSPPYFNLRAYGDSDKEIGRERTPEEFVAGMVSVFSEVRRILRKDGTLWLNMGDCYATGAGSGRSMGGKCFGKQNAVIDEGAYPECQANRMPLPGLKPKDLIGIPWMLAFALRADGWYLRSDIIWNKPNPMPESVTDRPTKSHEYIFLLTKNRDYFYDAEAVKESVSGTANPRGNGVNPKAKTPGKNSRVFQDRDPNHPSERKTPRPKQNESFSAAISGNLVTSRNKRSVWSVATAPFADAHFATYPPDLIKPCILAGTSERGCCADCGAPYERILEKPEFQNKGESSTKYDGQSTAGRLAKLRQAAREAGVEYTGTKKTLGWKKTCQCTTDLTKPCTVLDPFAGSGTTGEVAGELGRNFIGCELYEKFLPMIERRTSQPGLML